MPPAFYFASFCDTQLAINSYHVDSSRQITCCFLTKVAVGSSALPVFAENSVINAAEPILYIVPQDRPLTITAKLAPTDVEQAFSGQRVVIRLSGFDPNVTPELLGYVDQISADTFVDETSGQRFYQAEIHINLGELDRLPNNVILLPGMPVEAFINTTERTPLAYLLEPFTGYFMRAMRES